MQADSDIPWRMRPDLVVVQTDAGASESWTVKDPLRLKYFHLLPEEMTLLQLLTGSTSWRQILTAMQSAFPDVRFSLENLHAFLMSLVRSGLLVSTVPGHAELLLEQDRRGRAARRWQRMSSLLSHRFRGFDPNALLQRLDAVLGWIYRPSALAVMLLIILSAAFVAVTQADKIAVQLPELRRLITLDNLKYLFAAVVVIKIIHELGHGLTCCHHGGECHELGVLLVGFVPMLYCDVSDTWLQRNRWKRIQVSAAGIVVELLIASVCFLLWRFSIPGSLNLFLLNVTLVASVNTVLVNGNPLLRYDGYHVLTDLLRMPNLGTEARRLSGCWFDFVVLGIRLPPDAAELTLPKLGLIAYGIASMIYRFFVLSVIFWAMHQFLKPHGLEAIVIVLMVPVVAGLVVGAVHANYVRMRRIQLSRDQRASRRAAFGLTWFGVIVLVVLFIPLPHSVNAPFTLNSGGVPVFVAVDGRLASAVAAGTEVRAGDTIATLTNPDLQRRLVEQESELQMHELRHTALLGLRSTIPTASAALPAAEDAIASARERLQTLRLAIDQLRIVSPSGGRVVNQRNTTRQRTTEATQQFWFGNPLDAANRGTWLHRETLLCWVAKDSVRQADALVRQEDVVLIPPEATAELRFLSSVGDTVSAQVTIIGTNPGTEVARELAVNQLVSARQRDDRFVPAEIRYPVRMTLSAGATAPLYSSGVARISCRPMSLASRAWRAISHAFAFRL
ncbi:MAG: hypothetical protein R3C19_13870 [Planctomycetaceae bacterium]